MYTLYKEDQIKVTEGWIKNLSRLIKMAALMATGAEIKIFLDFSLACDNLNGVYD